LPFMVKLIDQFKKNGKVLIPEDFKGLDYQMKFLNSVIKGDIKPPPSEVLKKEQAKPVVNGANADVINQVLKDEPQLKEQQNIVEEEKVNNNGGGNEEKSSKLKGNGLPSALKLRNHKLPPESVQLSPYQNSYKPYQPKQNMNMMNQYVPFQNQFMMNNNFQPVPVFGNQVNGYIPNQNSGMAFNSSSSNNAWGNGDLPHSKKGKKPQSGGGILKEKNNSEVEKTVFVKKDAKKGRNIKHTAFRKKSDESSEDFPELDKGWVLKDK